MYELINNLKINYEIYGEGKPILLLHGWGGSINSLKNLALELSKKNYKVFIIDIPGFGDSSKPNKDFTLKDYADIVEEFLQKKRLNSLNVFGHSFGGSVAIKMSVSNKLIIKKLILCNSSGIRDIDDKKVNKIKRISKLIRRIFYLPILRSMYPRLRKFFYYYILRERDYINHQEIAGTFKKVVKEDLTPYLERIKIPVLLLWGENDKHTPIEYADIMDRNIKSSQLKVIRGAGHDLPLRKPKIVGNEIDKFINDR